MIPTRSTNFSELNCKEEPSGGGLDAMMKEAGYWFWLCGGCVVSCEMIVKANVCIERTIQLRFYPHHCRDVASLRRYVGAAMMRILVNRDHHPVYNPDSCSIGITMPEAHGMRRYRTVARDRNPHVSQELVNKALTITSRSAGDVQCLSNCLKSGRAGGLW